MCDYQKNKASLLAAAIMELRERDKVVDSVWNYMCKQAIEELDRMHHKGIDMSMDDVMKEIRTKINGYLEK